MDLAGCTFEFVKSIHSRLAVASVDVHASRHNPFGRSPYLITETHVSDTACDTIQARRNYLQDCNTTLVYATSNQSRAGDAD